MLRLITFIVMVLCVSFFANAAIIKQFPMAGDANPTFNDFDQKIIEYLQIWHMAGATVAVIKDNKLIYSRSYGWADKLHNKKMLPDAKFRVASISKSITAVAILKMIEQGKLSLHDNAYDILSNISPYKQQPINPDVFSISIKNLLQMSSGWFKESERIDPMFGPWPQSVEKILGEENFPANCYQVAKAMMSHQLSSEIGVEHSYSNFDYCLLGLIVNKVNSSKYGYKSFQRFVNEAILEPISIKDMKIGSTIPNQRLIDEVVYHQYAGPMNTSNLHKSTYLPYGNDHILEKNFANGGWLGSAVDLAKFASSVAHNQILSKTMVERMLARPDFVSSDATDYFAMGWQVKWLDQKRYWYKTGSFTGTNTIVFNRPDNVTIAVLFNSRPPLNSMFNQLRPKLINLLINTKVE